MYFSTRTLKSCKYVVRALLLAISFLSITHSIAAATGEESLTGTQPNVLVATSTECVPSSIDRPESGVVLQQRSVGDHELQIKNGTSQDTLIKLKAMDGVDVLIFFVRANSNVVVPQIPEGSYVLYGAVGEEFSISCLRFIKDMVAFKFEGYAEFETTEDATYIYTTILEYTLHEVVGGNIDRVDVPLEEF